MDEFEFIQRLGQALPGGAHVRTGIGDDCAVLDQGQRDGFQLFKTDAVVEGVHFESGTEPERVGHKALARVMSDIAAMAGAPGSAVVTLGLSNQADLERMVTLYRGMAGLAQRYDMAIVGGETVRNPERLFVSVTAIGWVERHRCVWRSGGRAGDALFVTGELGGAMEGKHLSFEPRLAEAQWLTEHFTLHSLIDLSDGLAGDLQHLTRASQVGAELLTESIPVSREARRLAREESAKKTPLLAALTDGEDYELLFSVASRDAVPLLDAWKARFPHVRLTCIGKLLEEKEIRLRDKHGARPMTSHGYMHFS